MTDTEDAELPAFLKLTDVAEILQVEAPTVRGWAREGKLKASKTHGDTGSYRVTREDFIRFVNNRFGAK